MPRLEEYSLHFQSTTHLDHFFLQEIYAVYLSFTTSASNLQVFQITVTV